ncbi:MAG: hypothetical protein LBU15_03670 [Rickettsiales bacterium]|jgi:hypothetical protein|nr:hypothetical protein [Rickettsiales bacterium]
MVVREFLRGVFSFAKLAPAMAVDPLAGSERTGGSDWRAIGDIVNAIDRTKSGSNSYENGGSKSSKLSRSPKSSEPSKSKTK